ncbi:MAG TPA: hypothetical protein VJM33_16165 [Microthrixaceae bacterium]|nr:hypothetical protein [Microthrixaceae bacterium]
MADVLAQTPAGVLVSLPGVGVVRASAYAAPANDPRVAAVAVGHRAHRLAFAMLRNQEPYDPKRWATAVAVGPVMAKTGGRPTRTT